MCEDGDRADEFRASIVRDLDGFLNEVHRERSPESGSGYENVHVIII